MWKGRFLKTPDFRLFVDGRKRNFSNTSWRHASCTNSTMHALWGMLSYFHRFVDWRKRFEYATCGRVFFRKRKGKKISGFKGRGLKLLLSFSFFFLFFFFLPFSLPWASSLIKLPHTLGEFPKSDGCSWHRNAMCFLLKSEVRLQFK